MARGPHDPREGFESASLEPACAALDFGLSVEAAGDRLLIRGPKHAESVVNLLAEHKAEVLVALGPAAPSPYPADQDKEADAADAQRWRDQLAARIVKWFDGDRDRKEAERLAWGDVINDWHQRNGQRWPAWQCAGCEAPIGGIQAFTLPDGNRVHDTLKCLIAFGKRWRGAAHTALAALGLEPPAES